MSASTWTKAWRTEIPQQIAAYNTLVDSFVGLRHARTVEEVESVLDNFKYGTMDIDAEKALDALSHMKASYMPTITGRVPKKNFGWWARKNFDRSDSFDAEEDLKNAAFWLQEYWEDESDDDYKEKNLVPVAKSFMKALDAYAKVIQSMLDQIYPPKFPYHGFTIYNNGKMAKPLVNAMLSGVDFMVSFFRDRDMLPLFQKGIKGFRLYYEDPEEENTVADFDDTNDTIGLYSKFLHRHTDLGDWMKNNLVHEFGHYVHMRYLDRNARKYWDSWWDKLDDIRQKKDSIGRPITQKERYYFLNKLSKVGFNLKRYRAKDTVEQVRLTTWLENPNPGGRLYKKIADPRLNSYKEMPKLTSYGKKVFAALADPDSDPDLRADYIELLGAESHHAYPSPPNHAVISVLAPLLADEQDLLELLQLPTNYAETNRYEDFAETFSRFMTDRDSLSPMAQYRLKKTLSLAGLYGKPVMKFSSVEKFVWERALKPVREFEKLYKSLQVLRKVRDEESFRKVVSTYRFKNLDFYETMEAIVRRVDFAAPTEQEEHEHPVGFARWVRTNYPKVYETRNPDLPSTMVYRDYVRMQDEADTLKIKAEAVLQDRKVNLERIADDAKDFLAQLDAYAKEMNRLLKKAMPAHFNYKNVNIRNPNRFAEGLVHTMVQGVDYLITLFKGRGLLPILEEGITAINLEYQSPHASRVSAHYDQEERSITVFTGVYESSDGKSWVRDVFLHEFGHHIHMTYIDENARRFWDSWWDTVEEAKRIEQLEAPITLRERQGFYKFLIEKDFNLHYVSIAHPNHYGLMEKARFFSWLAYPSKPLQYKLLIPYGITERDSMFNVTPLGEEILHTLKRVHESKSDDEEEIALAEDYKKLLGLTTGSPDMPVDEGISDQFLDDTSPDAKAVAALGIPTDYGSTDKLEDFAETFVYFVLHPRKLSSMAQYRLKRTLSLSGLYGKPVMTFAQVVEAMVSDGMSEEAIDLLKEAAQRFPHSYGIVHSRENGKVIMPLWEQTIKVDSLKRKGHVYRGMEEKEFKATVGRRKDIQSCGMYSHSSEGTCFAYDPSTAEDYVNFGRSDPLKTGKPNFLIEVDYRDQITPPGKPKPYVWDPQSEKAEGPHLQEDKRDGYPKAPGPTPFKRITRIWAMVPEEGQIRLYQIKV